MIWCLVSELGTWDWDWDWDWDFDLVQLGLAGLVGKI